MMDKPSLAEIVMAAREFLETKAIPELSGRTAFHARVAANALLIAEREIMQGPAANAAELSRLMTLLDQDGELEALNRVLCERIAAGDIGIETAGLKEHLTQTTIDKVKIDQPNYSGLRTALAAEGQGGAG